jgi:hypothetical protein
MDGLIEGRDVVLHLWTIGQQFGWACAGRCMRAVITRRRTTFLDVAFGSSPPGRGRGTGSRALPAPARRGAAGRSATKGRRNR